MFHPSILLHVCKEPRSKDAAAYLRSGCGYAFARKHGRPCSLQSSILQIDAFDLQRHISRARWVRPCLTNDNMRRVDSGPEDGCRANRICCITLHLHAVVLRFCLEFRFVMIDSLIQGILLKYLQLSSTATESCCLRSLQKPHLMQCNV